MDPSISDNREMIQALFRRYAPKTPWFSTLQCTISAILEASPTLTKLEAVLRGYDELRERTQCAEERRHEFERNSEERTRKLERLVVASERRSDILAIRHIVLDYEGGITTPMDTRHTIHVATAMP
jgi:hypothetical protein